MERRLRWSEMVFVSFGHEYVLNLQPAINLTYLLTKSCFYSLSTVWFCSSIGAHGVISNHLALW